MTTIGEVAVKLGLNSDDFMKDIDKVETEVEQLEKNLDETKESFNKMAKAMAMTAKPSKEMKNVFQTLKNELKNNQSAFDQLKNKAKQMGASFEQVNPVVQSLQDKLIQLTKVGFWVAATKKIIDMGKAAVKTAAQFEQLAVSFEVLAGGAEAGKKLTDQIVALASKTPLTTENLSDSARTLLSFGEAADEVINDLKLLGDISGGDAQKMQSLTLAFAQIGSQGKLAGQDLLQMINAGFNPLEQISQKTGKSIGQLKDEMSKGLITFKDVKQAMIDATSEGGRFYGMMNKQSETLEGRISTLSDNWSLLNKQVGDKFLPYIKDCIDKCIELASTIDTPLNMHLNVLDGLLKSIGGAFKGIRDVIGHLIPGTNNFSNVIATMNYNLAKTGIYLQYILAPIEALQNGKTFKDVIKGLNAQLKGINDYYYNQLSSGKYNPLLEDLDKVEAKTKEVKEGFDALSGSGIVNNKNKTKDEYKKIKDMIDNYKESVASAEISNQVGKGNAFLSGLSSQYKARLDLEIWYQDERRKIIKESNGNIELQEEAFGQVELLKTAKMAEANLTTWQEYGNSVSSILSQTFSSILTGQQKFSDAIKNLASNMFSQLLQMLIQYVMKEMAIRAASMFFGGTFGGGLAGAALSGATSVISSHHSGGMIPGTKEQLAVLQGGERVLNRSEAANYNSDDATGNGDVNNVMVFNIKAWDGKDVIDTLKSNAQTINQIVSSGIKNNNQGLRTVVQNT